MDGAPNENGAEAQEAAPAEGQAADDADAEEGPAVVVEMTDELTYEPRTVTIAAGETIAWRNSSNIVHTVTADLDKANDPSHVQLPEGVEPFDSGNIEPGGIYSRTFDASGRYRYLCIPHEAEDMIGEIVVEPKDEPQADGDDASQEAVAVAAAPEPEPAARDGPSPQAGSAALRGEYVFAAGGCASCHQTPGREAAASTLAADPSKRPLARSTSQHHHA